MDIGRTTLFRELGDLLAKVCPVRIRIRVSGVLEIVVGAKANTGAVRSYSGAHSFDNLQDKSASVLQRTAVCISSDVYVVVQELV